MNDDELTAEDASEQMFATLIDDYASFKKTKELRNKYRLRSYILITIVTILSILPGCFANTLWLAIPFMLLWVVSLAAFVCEFPKIRGYQISDENKIFVYLCKAYEETRLFRKQGSGSHLKEAKKALRKAISMISMTIHSSPWKVVNDFNDQMRILNETVETKILPNLTEDLPSDRVIAINSEIVKLAHLTRNMSTTVIRDYIASLNASKSIPSEPSIKLKLGQSASKKIIRSIQYHKQFWELAKAIGLFGFSSSVVLTFTWLLCQWQGANISDHIGNITTATFALWGILYWKTKRS